MENGSPSYFRTRFYIYSSALFNKVGELAGLVILHADNIFSLLEVRDGFFREWEHLGESQVGCPAGLKVLDRASLIIASVNPQPITRFL